MTASGGNADRERSSHPLDVATGLEKTGGDNLRGRSSDAYWNMASPWGGITSATMLRAVLEHANRLGDPVSLTVNFCAPISRSDFLVSVREIRTGRSTQHWWIDLSQQSKVAATATAVFGARRNVWSHQPACAPEVPDFDTLPKLPTEGRSNWLRQYEFRFALGIPQLGERASGELSSALSQVWLNHAQPRRLDFVALAAFADIFFVRIFQVRGRMVPVGTVSMTVHFHASSDDLVSLGNDPVLGVADANIFERGFCDQKAEIWSKSGRLLVTTSQMVHYAE